MGRVERRDGQCCVVEAGTTAGGASAMRSHGLHAPSASRSGVVIASSGGALA
jgi:hypothetical protein